MEDGPPNGLQTTQNEAWHFHVSSVNLTLSADIRRIPPIGIVVPLTNAPHFISQDGNLYPRREAGLLEYGPPVGSPGKLVCSQPSIFSLGVKPAHRGSREIWTLAQKGDTKGEGRRGARKYFFLSSPDPHPHALTLCARSRRSRSSRWKKETVYRQIGSHVFAITGPTPIATVLQQGFTPGWFWEIDAPLRWAGSRLAVVDARGTSAGEWEGELSTIFVLNNVWSDGCQWTVVNIVVWRHFEFRLLGATTEAIRTGKMKGKNLFVLCQSSLTK